jgi:hypothetical protein
MDWKEEVIDWKINLMQLITLHSHIGLDGILQLPLGMTTILDGAWDKG